MATTQLLEMMEQVVRGENLKYQMDPEHGVVLIPFGTSRGDWLTVGDVDAKRGFVTFRSLLPSAPQSAMSDVVEMLSRVNVGIRLGAFRLDLGDGDCSFRASACFGRGEPNAEVIRHLLRANIVMTETYLPGYQRVIAGEASPAEAVKWCEASIVGLGSGRPGAAAGPTRGRTVSQPRFGGRLSGLN